MFRTKHGLATQTRKGEVGAWVSVLFYTVSPITGEINKILPCPALARRMLPDALIDFCSRCGAWPRPQHAYQIQVSRRQPPQTKLATPHDSLEAKGDIFFFLSQTHFRHVSATPLSCGINDWDADCAMELCLCHAQLRLHSYANGDDPTRDPESARPSQ